jgi:hypothetical protein
MKLTFFNNPDDTLRSAEAALASTDAKLVDLLAQRAAKLLEADFEAAVEAIDRKIEAHRRAVAIGRDRVVALAQKRRADELNRLQREKSDKIAVTQKLVTRRDSAALKLESALIKVREAYTELSEVDQTIFPSGSYLSVASLPALCRRDRRSSDPMPRLIVGPVRAIADGAGTGLSAEIQQKGRDLIETMTAEPIPEPLDEHEASEAA